MTRSVVSGFVSKNVTHATEIQRGRGMKFNFNYCLFKVKIVYIDDRKKESPVYTLSNIERNKFQKNLLTCFT